MLLFTTTHYVLGYSEDAGYRLIHTGRGLYYGIAEHAGRIYISCRNGTEGPTDAASRAAETGSILVLDASTLRPVEELLPGDFPMRDLHGIAVCFGKLWATCSFDNMIAICDLQTREWERWYPSPDPAARNRDVNHFNTVTLDDDGQRLHLIAHNNGPSEVFTFRAPALELESVSHLGVQAHDIFSWQGSRATCSSGEGLLLNAAGWKLRTGGFPRGIVRTDDSVWVGISQIAPRQERHKASGIVRRYTSDWTSAVDHLLPGVGMILQVNQIDSDARLASFPAFECAERSMLTAAYYSGAGSCGLRFNAGWHAAEGTHRWTAALQASVGVVVNPGERRILVDLFSSFDGPFSVDVLINGMPMASCAWEAPGPAVVSGALPHGVDGSCTLTFQVPHLWTPFRSEACADERWLGVAVRRIEFAD